MSSNNRALNVVASRKRKCTDHHQASSVSRKSELQLFPTHPQHQEFVDVSQITPCVQKQISLGQNLQRFTCTINSDHYNPNHGHSFFSINEQAPSEAKDPLESFFKSQYQQLRETCEQHFKNKYINLLRLAEEGAAMVLTEKDMEMAYSHRQISNLNEKVASLSTQVTHLHEVIKNKDTELANIRRKNVELEQKQVHYNSEVHVCKEMIEKAEVMLWNSNKSPRRHSPCLCEEVDTASSVVGLKVMEGVASCKVCGKGTATVTMWPCRHLCICKMCDVPQTSTRRCPVCNLLSIRVEV